LLAAALALAGCGPGQRPPLFWNSEVQPHDVGLVTVLPALDGRVDREIEVEFDAQLADEAVRLLRERGYEATRGALPADVTGLTLDELTVADAATIRRLGSSGAGWVLVIGLVDVTTALTFGSTGNAEVAGYLFDTKNGALQWRDKGVGQAGQGGLIGMAMIAGMDEMAIESALRKLIAGLPPRATAASRATGPGLP
jgi:hypothetical protein